MSENLPVRKSEILFLYESTYSIPNGDPFTGEQRYDDETKKFSSAMFASSGSSVIILLIKAKTMKALMFSSSMTKAHLLLKQTKK